MTEFLIKLIITTPVIFIVFVAGRIFEKFYDLNPVHYYGIIISCLLTSILFSIKLKNEEQK